MLGVVGLVGEQGFALGWQEGQQDVGPFQIVGLSRSKVQARGVAQGIACGVNFGGGAAPTLAYGLGCRVPPFAPAAC